MNRLVPSGPTVSRVCFMAMEATVTMESTWVWPRVNKPEPWVRGSRPTSQVMGRISVVPRPSGRMPWSKIRLRTTSFREL